MPPKALSLRHNIVRLVGAAGMLSAAIWILLNQTYIIDQIAVWRFTPSADISQIASRAVLTDKGRFYLYASRPEINDRASFNTHCRQLVEKTSILGCYVNRQIYIFNITDQRLDGIREVTAAHEMLHAAYDRLSVSERGRIDRLIEAQATNISDQKLKDRLALYDQTEPGERLNELHSILATEIRTLSPELENYYRQYFTDRAKVVALAEGYETVFRQIESQQTQLIAELNQLADRIDSASKDYETTLAALKVDIAQFNRRATAGEFPSQAAFNRDRNQLVARQDALQAQRDAINGMITDYHAKTAQLDTLNTTAEGLQRSIDSTLPEAPRLQ